MENNNVYILFSWEAEGWYMHVSILTRFAISPRNCLWNTFVWKDMVLAHSAEILPIYTNEGIS